MDTTKLRIAAVERNDVAALTRLADATEWYKFTQPDSGNTLLHIAFFHRALEVFHYLLSIADFPLNHKNGRGKTVLCLCLNPSGSDTNNDPFTCELIKKGAVVDAEIYEEEGTLLHFAIKEALVDVAKLLIQMGHDVNAQNSEGVTPLWLCIDGSCPDQVETEIITALLCNGADPALGRVHYNAFEYSVRFSSYTVQEALFNYMIDDFTSMNIHIEILLILADERSHFFRHTLERVNDVIVTQPSACYYHLLFSININDLMLLIKKCPEAIRQVCHEVTPLYYKTSDFCEKMSLDNINCLIESELRDDTIDFICRFNDQFFFYLLIGFGCEESVALESVCFLLSYGLVLNESNLRTFYKRYGFGDLLKLILHTEIKPKLTKQYIKEPHLLLLYDIHCDLEQILENYYNFENLSELLYYFSNAKLRELCSYEGQAVVIAKQPFVPLLAELSRTVFRKFFVRTFAIESARQFYTLINKLPIAPLHKKIITLEMKLY